MKEFFQSFSSSIDRFREILGKEKTVENRDSAIQRFEFTIELAWKNVQKFLKSENIICRSPKECLREAFKFGLLEDDPAWIQAFEDRNETVHAYDEKTADEVYGRLPKYLVIFEKLLSALDKKIN